MIKNAKKIYEDVLITTGLNLDETSGVMYGTRNGFSVLVYALAPQHPDVLHIAIAAKSHTPLTKNDIQEAKQICSNIRTIEQENNCVYIYPKPVFLHAKLPEQIEDVLQASVNFLAEKGFTACCQSCGKEGEMSPVAVGNRYLTVCDDCFVTFQQNIQLANHSDLLKKENTLSGIVGAFLGSVIGAICIVLVSQLGYVAALSGIIMAICTLKGYELLGGKLSKKGIIISLIIMILMTYAADRLDWALVISREFEEDLFVSYQAVGLLIEENIIEMTDYIANLGMVYLFLAIGAVPVIFKSFTKNKTVSAYRMGSSYTS